MARLPASALPWPHTSQQPQTSRTAVARSAQGARSPTTAAERRTRPCCRSPRSAPPPAGTLTSPRQRYWPENKEVGDEDGRRIRIIGSTTAGGKHGKTAETQKPGGHSGGRRHLRRCGRVLVEFEHGHEHGRQLLVVLVGDLDDGELAGNDDHPGVQSLRRHPGRLRHGRDRAHLRAADPVRPRQPDRLVPVAGDVLLLGGRRQADHVHHPPGREVEQRHADDRGRRRLHLRHGQGERVGQPGRAEHLQRVHLG